MADASYKDAFEIYKLAYERAAQRYNDLYTSAWTNFSYMALLSGGLLTFGGTRFITAVTVFVACLPLLFWWAATFEPLNRYGDQVLEELKSIEEALNKLLMSQPLPTGVQESISHYSNFAERNKSTTVGKIWRVRYAIRIMAAVLIVVMVWSGRTAVRHWQRGELAIKQEPLTIVVASPTPTPTPTPMPGKA